MDILQEVHDAATRNQDKSADENASLTNEIQHLRQVNMQFAAKTAAVEKFFDIYREAKEVERVQAASTCGTLTEQELAQIVEELENKCDSTILDTEDREYKLQVAIRNLRVEAEQAQLDRYVDRAVLPKFPILALKFGPEIKNLRESIRYLKKEKIDNESAISDTLPQLVHLSAKYHSHLEKEMLTAYNGLEEREAMPELPGWKEQCQVEKHCREYANAVISRFSIIRKLSSEKEFTETLCENLKNCKHGRVGNTPEEYFSNFIDLYNSEELRLKLCADEACQMKACIEKRLADIKKKCDDAGLLPPQPVDPPIWSFSIPEENLNQYVDQVLANAADLAPGVAGHLLKKAIDEATKADVTNGCLGKILDDIGKLVEQTNEPAFFAMWFNTVAYLTRSLAIQDSRMRVPKEIFFKLVCHLNVTVKKDLIAALLEIDPTVEAAAKQDAEPGSQMFPKFVSLSMAARTEIETTPLEESIIKMEELYHEFVEARIPSKLIEKIFLEFFKALVKECLIDNLLVTRNLCGSTQGRKIASKTEIVVRFCQRLQVKQDFQQVFLPLTIAAKIMSCDPQEEKFDWLDDATTVLAKKQILKIRVNCSMRDKLVSDPTLGLIDKHLRGPEFNGMDEPLFSDKLKDPAIDLAYELDEPEPYDIPHCVTSLLLLP